MNGYPKLKVGATYRVAGACWRGWAQGSLVTITSVNHVVVVMRRHGILDVDFTLPRPTFRAMFEEVK
jgi:hypothetical protein